MESGYVLVNIAHHERRPASPRAAFRILGVFSGVDDARAHIQASLTVDVDMVLAPLGSFFALTRSSVTSEKQHIDQLQQAHARRLRLHEDEFRENVTAQKTGESSEASQVSPSETSQSTDNKESSHEGRSDSAPAKVPRSAELRLQNFAVISVLPDATEDDPNFQQPGAVVWGVYDTEELAKTAIKAKHAPLITDLHLEVVQLYEWLHPTEVFRDLDQLEEEFRDEKLTEIIRHRKDEKRHVKTFRSMCGDNKPPLIDVSSREVRLVNHCEGAQGSLETVPDSMGHNMAAP